MSVGNSSREVHGTGVGNARAKSTYAQIFKSSALIGGSSLLTILVGMVRTKVMALLLGPAGIGLMATYSSIIDLTRSVAELGINRSGVRQIAQAAGSGDHQRLALTVTVLRRTSLLLGSTGVLLLLLLAHPLAETTFGNGERGPAIMALSVVVFLGLIGDGQAAFLQGSRRIAELAKLGVYGSLFGTAVAIPIIYLLGESGIVWALIAAAAATAVISWYYANSIPVAAYPLSFSEWRMEAAELLRVGISFMASALLMMAAAYAVRIIVLRHSGLEGAGFYQAAWTVGGLYVGFILQAMGTDFYPRLVAASSDNDECNRLVNEQTVVSLLLAGPGILATLTSAPAVVSVFYSKEFEQSVEPLRWVCIGMAMRVLTWPMGYIIIAKNRQKAFVATELLWAIANVALSWILVQANGVRGAGQAFLIAYLAHAAVIYPLVRSMTGFTWSKTNQKLAIVFIVATTATMLSLEFLAHPFDMICASLLLLAVCAISVRQLFSLLGHGVQLPRFVVKLAKLSRLLPADF